LPTVKEKQSNLHKKVKIYNIIVKILIENTAINTYNRKGILRSDKL